MTYVEAEISTRLQGVFHGFPRDLLAPATLDRLARLCADLDALGRLDPDSHEPMVEEHTLLTLLRSAVDRPLADHVIAVLDAQPGSALRRAKSDQRPPDEVGWYGLAANVGIYDTTPATTFAQLHVPGRGSTGDIVDGVNAEFPSLEKELLDPAQLSRRIVSLVMADNLDALHAALREIARQLGWWAVVVAVLLIPLAMTATTPVPGERSEAEHLNAWPLGMFIFATAVGGWTLTVVGSCILAPHE